MFNVGLGCSSPFKPLSIFDLFTFVRGSKTYHKSNQPLNVPWAALNKGLTFDDNRKENIIVHNVLSVELVRHLHLTNLETKN